MLNTLTSTTVRARKTLQEKIKEIAKKYETTALIEQQSLLVFMGLQLMATFLSVNSLAKTSESKLAKPVTANRVLYYESYESATSSKGQLKPMVFVHGSPGSHKAFEAYLRDPDLKSKFHMVSVDRLGFGRSVQTVELSFKKQSLAIIGAVEKAFQIKNSVHKVTCVGHSYGAPLCLKLLKDRPDLFDQVVLIAGVFNPHRKILRWYNSVARVFLVKWLISQSWNTSNQEMYGLKKELLLLEKELDRENGSNLQGKVKLIHGRADKIVPFEDSVWLYQKLKPISEPPHKTLKLTFKKIKKQGHFIIWDDFDIIKRELLRF